MVNRYICFIQSLNNNILSLQTLDQNDVQSVKPKYVFKDLFAKSFEGAFGLFLNCSVCTYRANSTLARDDKKLKGSKTKPGMIICAAAVGLLGANAALLLFRDNNAASCVNIG